MKCLHQRVVAFAITLLAVSFFCCAAPSTYAAGNKTKTGNTDNAIAAPVMNPLIVSAMMQNTMANGPTLLRTTISSSEVVVTWDGSQIDLYIDNVPVANLMTGYDHLGRPAFRTDDDNGPQGFVDIDPDGYLIVKIAGLSEDPVRLGLVDGEAVALRDEKTCSCFGTGTDQKDCTNKQCDDGDDCTKHSGTRHCRWSAGLHHGGPIIPIDPKAIVNIPNQ